MDLPQRSMPSKRMNAPRLDGRAADMLSSPIRIHWDGMCRNDDYVS